MYLDEDTIRAILSKCGYAENEKLYLSSSYRMTKHQGDLYRAVLKTLKVDAANVLHIGDNLQNDVTNAQKYGINAVLFPRALDVFENKIADTPTGECSTVARPAGGTVLDPQALMDSLGYRTMIAMIANCYSTILFAVLIHRLTLTPIRILLGIIHWDAPVRINDLAPAFIK
jgi:hypothetical protein